MVETYKQRVSRPSRGAWIEIALVDKALPIEYGDYFKDTLTGLTYRVTSNPSEKESPKSATFALKYFTAERKELPK